MFLLFQKKLVFSKVYPFWNNVRVSKGIKRWCFPFLLLQGSNEFVKRYLIPQILRKYGQSDIGGAFIADTIMNLNRTINSQEVPKEWNKIDPNTANKIEENDLKGDFLAIFQRRQPDASLVSIFRYVLKLNFCCSYCDWEMKLLIFLTFYSKHWNYLQQDTSNEDYFKLRPFRLDIGKQTPTLDTLSDMVYFVRSDHSRYIPTYYLLFRIKFKI